jgi:hypothetical protein
MLFNSPDFFRIFRNTLLFNFYRLLFQFPIPIIMALAIYEVKNRFFKRSVQTLSYLPHFLSWVIIGAIFMNLLSTQGMINSILRMFGQEPIVWLAQSRYFRSLLVISDAWKNSGWGSIVYLSAIMSIDTDLFEAAPRRRRRCLPAYVAHHAARHPPDIFLHHHACASAPMLGFGCRADPGAVQPAGRLRVRRCDQLLCLSRRPDQHEVLLLLGRRPLLVR